MTKLNIVLVAVVCLLAISGAVMPVFAKDDGAGDGGAVLNKVKGNVLVRESGSDVWRAPEEGMQLFRGDEVRTGAGASAMITLPGSGYAKLLPMSEITVDYALSPQGSPSPVLEMKGGRVWAQMNISSKDGQFIVVTGNAIVNGSKAGAFIEDAGDHLNSCLDVMKGSVSIRPIADQQKVTTLQAGQRSIMVVDRDGAPPSPIGVNFDDSRLDMYCLAPEGQEEPEVATGETAAPTGSQISEDDNLFTFETPTPAASGGGTTATPTGGETAGTSSGGEAAQEEEEEEYEYETVVVSGNVSFNVIKSSPSCSGAPVISDVMVGIQPVAAGDALVMKSISKCGPLIKPTITWTATPKCGTISTMFLTSGGIVTRIPGGDASGAASGKAVVEIADTTVRDIVIRALDSYGVETKLTFQLLVSAEDTLPPPRIINLTVNSAPIKANTDLEISSDMCEQMQFLIEGEAKSDCGEIVSVTVTAHEAPLTVIGTDDWEASLYINEAQSVPVLVVARDITGARSLPYKFNIEFSKTVSPPDVSIETIAGYPAPAMGEYLDVYRNDLTGGKLVIAGGAGSDMCYIKKVEVSTDNGGVWSKADGSSGWSYGFIPRDGDYEILARSYDNGENTSDEMFMPIEITYFSKTREEILQEAFETLLRAYQDHDADTIISGTAANFSSTGDSIEDRGRLDSALNGKFLEISSVYLRYRVESVSVSGSSGRVTFSWDASPSGSGYSKTGTFIFQKEGRPDWKLITVEDSRSFLRYTNIAETIGLTALATRLTANNTDTTTITATVKDSAGNAVKNGTPVHFTATTGTIDASAATADGKVELTYTAGDAIGTATITATSGSASASFDLTLTREYAPPPPPAP